MVLMVLDHTRDFFSDPALDPTELASTTMPLFLTRWVTHFCAPVFLFLAGAGAYLARALGKISTSRELAVYLATRGLFLVVMELTLVRWGWNFNFDYHFVMVQVIWVIGGSMLLLAALVSVGLSARSIGAIGLTVFLGHTLLDLKRFTVAPGSLGGWSWLWNVLLRPGAIPLGTHNEVMVAYPLLPWFGVMAAGFGFGAVLLFNRGERIRFTLTLGMALTLLFVVLRAVNVYGDPAPWKVQDSVGKTVMAFLNCEKYPPSLLYVLMTLGPGLVALSVFEATEDALARSTGPIRRALETLGRVPLFFYVLQWPVIHVLANLVSALSNRPLDWFVWPFDYPPGYGYGLPMIYAMWALVVALLYVPSRWYARYKQRHRDKVWLSYV
jgi:uncharacterized membrane protein